jgi:Fe-S-cluster containining protein
MIPGLSDEACIQCGVCCIALRVKLPDGTDKPAGEPCPHLILRTEERLASCRIYDHRPKACEFFFCVDLIPL